MYPLFNAFTLSCMYGVFGFGGGPFATSPGGFEQSAVRDAV